MSILVLSIDTIRGATYEIGDFAANSLLIQDAKSLRLLVGNYSRVGFNHPGPAILYVLAFGELVFHDWLRITSPVGGQLVASAMYAAVWVTLIAIVATQLIGDRILVAVFMAAFLCASSVFDMLGHRATFLGLWPPHLYCMPFAAFALALAEISLGRARPLPIAAIAAGVLANGHIAFIPICGVMLIGSLIANQVFARILPSPIGNWLSSEFLRVNHALIALSVGLGALFFVPLLILTVTDYPGPVAEYLRFGRGNPHNTGVASLQYVLFFLGGLLPALLGLFAFGAVFVIGRKREQLVRPSAALLAVLFGATLATWVYAKFGIDNLSHRYLADYYYAVPSLFLAYIAACFVVISPQLARKPLAILLIGTSLSWWAWAVHQTRWQDHLYHDETIPAFYSALAAQGQSVALYIGTPTWAVAHKVLGSMAMAKRTGRPTICIAWKWHVVFTQQARCTDAQIRDGRRLAVRRAIPGETPIAEVDDVAIFPAD